MKISSKKSLATVGIVSVVALIFISVSFALQSQKTRFIAGKVVNEAGVGVQGARVRIQAEGEFVLSDASGMFMIPLDKTKLQTGKRHAIIAGKEKYFNGGKLFIPGEGPIIIKLQKISNRDNKNYDFVVTSPIHPSFAANDNVNCANCHTTHLWEWGSSKMGKSALNNEVLAEYKHFKTSSRYKNENNCTDCHAPLAAAKDSVNKSFDQVVHTNSNRSKGIECDFCHKISNVEISNKAGVQSMQFTRQHFGRGMMQWIMAYGPYDDVMSMPMAASYHPLYQKSEYCSSCHQDAWKLTDGQNWDYLSVYPEARAETLYEKGTVIPNQWTYQEWKEWQADLTDNHQDKGTTCQDCHMNWSKDMMPYYRYIVSGQIRAQFGNKRDPDTITPHRFQGATAKMLTGVANLKVDANIEGNKLAVNVDVTNVNAGHRLPTGEASRNLILLVDAKDGDGNSLNLIDGAKVPEWGGNGQGNLDYANLPGKGYARIFKDEKGNAPVPTWDAVSIISDNRLKPKMTDTSSYQFQIPVGIDTEDISITAKLIYRKKFKTTSINDKKQLNEMVIEEKTIDMDAGGL